MLKSKRMKKIIVAAPKTYESRLVNRLYELKVLHITEHSRSEELDIGMPMKHAAQLSETLVRVRSLISNLNSREFRQAMEKTAGSKSKAAREHRMTSKKTKKEELNAKAVVAEVNRLYGEMSSVINDYKAVEEGIRRASEKLGRLQLLERLGLGADSLLGYESISYFIGSVEKPAEMLNEVRRHTTRFHSRTVQHEGKFVVALFIDAKLRQDAIPILEKHRFQAIDFSGLLEEEAARGRGSGKKALPHQGLQREIRNLHDKGTQLEKKMVLYNHRHASFLASAESFISAELEKAESPLKFAATDEAFIASGWIPADRLIETASEIRRVTRGKVYVEVHEPGPHEEDVPVQLDNPKSVKSYELLMGLYALPKFHEIDPTFFIFLSFPLLFGFMLGDIGYGLATLIVFYILKKAMPQFKMFFNILIFSSLATIFFGALFGEFFGYGQILGMHLPHILSRSLQLMDLLEISVVVGIVHINIGLLIGFYNVMMQHGFLSAVFEKISWMVLQAAAAVAYFVAPLPGIVLGVVALVMLYLGEGIKGLVEFPSIFSNILSYARLMAIGVASVKLAEVVDEFAGGFFQQGGVGILYAVLLLVVGHAINILLGLIGPFLHSLRLHYVEFFTKFFEGGGKDYEPFGYRAD
jgi:V/A-type H+-transporting ATPase subunit I